MIQEQNLGATFTEQCVATQNLARGQSRRAILAETGKDSFTVVVAIPAVIFFPDETIKPPFHWLYVYL